MVHQRSTVQWCMLNASISPHSVQLRPTSSLSFGEHLPLPLDEHLHFHRRPSTTLAGDARRQPADAILGAHMTHLQLSFVCSLLCLSPAAARDARRHHMCSCAAFVTIMFATPPSQRGQCGLSMSGEVLPKIVGDSISTEMEMKNEKQQSAGGKKTTR